MAQEAGLRLVREMPPDRISWTIDNIVGGAIMLGGGVAGSIGIGYFASNGWVGAAAGFFAGLITAGHAADRVRNSIGLARQMAYDSREEEADRKAKAMGARSAVFSYGNKSAECVIRHEYGLLGHEFKMILAGSQIENASFGYLTHESARLAFAFTAPRFRVPSEDIQILQMELGCLVSTKDDQTSVKVSQIKNNFYAVALYYGEDFMDRLRFFGDFCSNAMEKAEALAKHLNGQ